MRGDITAPINGRAPARRIAVPAITAGVPAAIS